MQQLLLVAAGGAAGAVLRFVIAGSMAAAFGRDFPYGTLLVNVTGSLLIGFLFVALSARAEDSEVWRSLLVVGFLGALTTFSTFSIETVQLIENGALMRALTNVVLNVLMCIVACWGGVWLARH